MKFSRRTGWETLENPMSAALKKIQAANHPVIDLTLSNPTVAGFSYLNEKILVPFQNKENLVYEPNSRGNLSARQAVVRYYEERGIQIDPNQIFLTSSTSEAYLSLFRLLADPSEGILIPKPSYPLFDYLCGLSDLETIPYALDKKGGVWRIDESLFDQPRRDIKALISVNPNNPTGNYVSAEEAKRLADYLQKLDAAIISDEVFWDYSMANTSEKRFSFANATGPLTFTLSGISKILGLPQMKLSWIVVSGGSREEHKQALERLEIIMDTTLPVNTPAQHALQAWLESSGACAEILARTTQNLNTALKVLGQAGISIDAPEGGWYVIIELSGALSDEALALEILMEDHVHVHPGFLFDLTGKESLVISLLPEPARFSEGLNKVAARLKNVLLRQNRF